MVKARFVGGLLMMVGAAILLVFAEGSYPLPVAISLLVVGIALIAASRKRAKSEV